MSLIKITTTPIEYEIKIERASLRVSEENNRKDAVKALQANQVRRDTSTVARNTTQRSDRQASFEQMARAKRPVRATGVSSLLQQQATATANTATTSGSVSTSSDYTQSQLQSIDTVVVDSSVDEGMFVDTADISYVTDNTPSEWSVQKSNMEYVQGRFQMEILQFPKVSIEYTGGPIYVPKSSDPDYEETE